MADNPGARAAWRTVLTHVDGNPASAARLDAAVALARRFDALLLGLGAVTVEPSGIADPYGISGMDATALIALREQATLELERAETRFRAAVGELRAEWRTNDDRPAAALARTARAADVVVAGGMAGKSDPHRAADPAEVALLCGRPVLVVPAQAAPLSGARAVLAWKDSRESRRAVVDALPLLAGAEEVLVMEVCDKGDVEDATFRTEDVAAALRRHGVAARAKTAVARDEDVAVRLNGEAAAIGADLIVAGCYGRGRFNEWLFGGATIDLLDAPDRYLLVSH